MAAMSGPLPDPNKSERRRRKPWELASHRLPAAGRQGPAPKPPQPLAGAALAWWQWAWKTPQACAWDVSTLYIVHRRAGIEGELAENAEAPVETPAEAKHLATAHVSLSRAADALDDKLGLSPKGLAMLRWTIEGEPAPMELEDRGLPETPTVEVEPDEPNPVAEARAAQRDRMLDRIQGPEAPVIDLHPPANDGNDIFAGLFDPPEGV
jgi:hypothetical protein